MYALSLIGLPHFYGSLASSSGERSFTKIKLIENRLQPPMKQQFLLAINMAVMSFETDMLREYKGARKLAGLLVWYQIWRLISRLYSATRTVHSCAVWTLRIASIQSYSPFGTLNLSYTLPSPSYQVPSTPDSSAAWEDRSSVLPKYTTLKQCPNMGRNIFLRKW